jgi:putative transposase
LLLDQNDEWVPQRRYMTLETLAEVGDNPNISLSAVAV